MKAVVCSSLGSVENLQVLDVPTPKPRPGEVRVTVKAASLNFMDVLMVHGRYQTKLPLPFTPGNELSGVVSELGSGVQGIRIGDRVAALASGAFAQEAIMPAAHLIPVPDEMSFMVAASFFVAYGTAVRALRTCAHLSPAEVLLVLGGAGGVGLAAIEVGRAMGAKVIAVASTAEKRAACLSAGAQTAIGYENLRRECDEFTDQRGVDVVFDPVGGALTEAAVRATAWRGRVVIVGFASGAVPSIPMNLALLKERTITGVYLGGSIDRDPDGNAENYRLLSQWYTNGALRPLISEQVDLEGVPAALGRMERRQVVGKIVVLP